MCIRTASHFSMRGHTQRFARRHADIYMGNAGRTLFTYRAARRVGDFARSASSLAFRSSAAFEGVRLRGVVVAYDCTQRSAWWYSASRTKIPHYLCMGREGSDLHGGERSDLCGNGRLCALTVLPRVGVVPPVSTALSHQ